MSTTNPLDEWRGFVVSLYPNAGTGTFSVPPLHLNRLSYRRVVVPGTKEAAFVIPNSSGNTTAGTVTPGTTASGSAPPPGTTASGNVAAGSAPSHGTCTASGGSVTPGNVAAIPATLPGSAPSASGNYPPGNIASVSVTPGSAQSATNVAHTKVPSGSASSGNAPPGSVASVGVTTGSAQSADSVATSTVVPSLRSVPSGPSGSTACQHGLAPPRVLWTQDPPELTLDNVQESDFHDDFAQNHVVTNLQVLGERRQKPMFILSQLGFGCYLDKPAYSAAAALLPQGCLPKPQDLDTEQLKYSRGEADIILFHRRYGVLIIEIKAVGRWNAVVKNTAAPDKDVVKRIEKAVKQLDKSEKVVSYVVSDIAPDLTVRKCLFLPYVKTEQLERVLKCNPKLAQVTMQE